MYYTYVLKSGAGNMLYVGFSKNLKQRLELHRRGAVESTRGRRPLELAYYETFSEKDGQV